LLMEFTKLPELTIYGGLVTGLVLMYLSFLKLSLLDYTPLLSMVKKDVVKELWMLDITWIMVITLPLMISQPLEKVKLMLLIHPFVLLLPSILNVIIKDKKLKSLIKLIA